MPDIVIPAASGQAQTLVIFVHGILGNPTNTFKDENVEAGWPQLLATDSQLGSHVDVMSVGYASSPLKRASNINEIATRLRYRLEDKGVFERFSKVIFITHSMGGLVARRMLLQLSQDNPAAYGKVAGVFFLATPSGGSNEAEIAAWVSRNPQFDNMAPSDVNIFLQMQDDDWAAQLKKRTTNAPYPRTFCVYETQAVGTTVVVPRSRALSACDDRPTAFDRNHINLVKPRNREDDVYTFVAARLKRLISDEYVPLTITATLNATSGEKLMGFPVKLKSGEQFRVEVEASRPAWFYIVWHTSSGTYERLYPSRLGGKQQQALRSIQIPAGQETAITLDSTAGSESIYVFASVAGNASFSDLDREVGARSRASAQSGTVRGGFFSAVASAQPVEAEFKSSSAIGEPLATLNIVHMK
jgi:pimeloyl-ACP methyl ester carboxylesterase